MLVGPTKICAYRCATIGQTLNVQKFEAVVHAFLWFSFLISRKYTDAILKQQTLLFKFLNDLGVVGICLLIGRQINK